jgi:chemotaxis protein histidine kinase CheA
MAEYFAMEAGEYLERLQALVANEGAPPPDELVRFTRALRGSALMANQPLVARTAAGLEAVAKAYRENRRPWDAALRERSVKAVADLRALVRTAGAWNEEENTRAERLALDMESLGGVASPAGPRPTPPPSAAPGSDAGVRAFVAREGALTASALDRAARALRTTPEAHEPLYAVLRRLQSLRGLAALTDLAPLPDVLDSVERAVGELTRMFAPPPHVADVFEAAAQALARGSRDVAQTGKPSQDADEVRRFAELLLRAFATESDVVPIESLFGEGQ